MIERTALLTVGAYMRGCEVTKQTPNSEDLDRLLFWVETALTRFHENNEILSALLINRTIYPVIDGGEIEFYRYDGGPCDTCSQLNCPGNKGFVPAVGTGIILFN